VAARVKRRVSLKAVSTCYWLNTAGNRNSNARPGNMDQTALLERNLEHSYEFIIPEIIKDKIITKTIMPYIKMTGVQHTS
jgi:hypothetical protein